MFFDVLKFFEILAGALGNFAQEQLAITGPHGEVTAFAIRGCATCDFHQEGCSALGEIFQQLWFHDRTEVVGVRDKSIGHTGGE